MALDYGFALGESGRLYTSGQFAEAFGELFGDGVCHWGGRFAAGVEGMGVTVSSGFGMIRGYWLKNDEPVTLPAAPAYGHSDRIDLLCLCLDETDRRVYLELLENTTAEEAGRDLLPLYSLKVKRGVTGLLAGDLTDLRPLLPAVATLTKEGLRAYGFVSGGMEGEIDRILGQAQALIDKAEKAVVELDKAIVMAGAGAAIGELCTARHHPQPENAWLLCNGGAIPPGYTRLAEMLPGGLPDIPPAQGKLATYIFAGAPELPGVRA